MTFSTAPLELGETTLNDFCFIDSWTSRSKHVNNGEDKICTRLGSHSVRFWSLLECSRMSHDTFVRPYHNQLILLREAEIQCFYLIIKEKLCLQKGRAGVWTDGISVACLQTAHHTRVSNELRLTQWNTLPIWYQFGFMEQPFPSPSWQPTKKWWMKRVLKLFDTHYLDLISYFSPFLTDMHLTLDLKKEYLSFAIFKLGEIAHVLNYVEIYSFQVACKY